MSKAILVEGTETNPIFHTLNSTYNYNQTRV